VPIIYDKTKQGFTLDNPSEEELEAIKKIAIDYITMSLGKMAALRFLSSLDNEPGLKEELEAMSTTESTIRH